MDESIFARFDELARQRSPENLSCDGELSRRQIQFRHRTIMAEWVKLEKLVGRKVKLSEIEGRLIEKADYGLGYMQGRGAA